VNSLFNVDGLIVVITGGGTGLGLMMAKALESNGATVYILGRRLEVIQEAASENNKRGKLIAIQCDTTSKDSLQAAVKTIESQTGYINLLVNNAGIMGPFYSTDSPKNPSVKEMQDFLWNIASPEEFTSVLHANITGAWYTTIAFMSLLSEGNKEGRGITGVTSQVITVSSIGGFRRDGNWMSPAYQSSKAGVTLLGKSMSNMLKDFDIRSNIIAPGLFGSEMTESIIKTSYPKDVIPLQRPGDEQDMSGLILYLASRAGAYVNGNVSLLDGGRLGTFASTY